MPADGETVDAVKRKRPSGLRVATDENGHTSHHYDFAVSPAFFKTWLSGLLLKEFKEVTKACLKAGVTREHLTTMVAEGARGGRK